MSSSNVYSRFQSTADIFPEKIAVNDGESSYTYHELAVSASSVASALSARGCKPGAVVAVLCTRTADTIAAILGTIKVGAVYMPLDPGYPHHRIENSLRQSNASFVIGTDESLATMPVVDAELLSLTEVLGAPGDIDTTVHTHPQGHAYVIFTSGSTGTPKGAINSHDALRRLCDNIHSLWGECDAPLNVAVVAPFAFDASLQQIFPSLTGGHTLHIVPEDVRANGIALIEYLSSNGIDVADGTPSHLQLMAEAMRRDSANAPEVRHFVIGGEPLLHATVREFYSHYGETAPLVTNVYGVAECAVDSTSYTVTRETLPLTSGAIPIGVPLLGTKLFLVDSDLNEVEDGIPGEILIAGQCVGAGYLNEPERTKSAFLSGVFPDYDRIYRTGDIAVRNELGQLTFVGRRDRQIKLRGNRIELGDVEAAIRLYGTGSIRECSGSQFSRCVKCVLPADFPGASLDKNGVCSDCRSFEVQKATIASYFRNESELHTLIRNCNAQPVTGCGYDCLMLYSGGKDSTYALCKLVEHGYRVLAYTFDNGFISKAALANAQRMTKTLGVDHEIGTIDGMNGVFRASLEQDSTVCTGCFRGLSTQSTLLAIEKGIRVVVSGLSRGQIYDTKLKNLIRSGITSVCDIEAQLKEHRKYYHANRDSIAAKLAISDPVGDQLDEIEFVDFFRYSGDTVEDIRDFLGTRGDVWQTPKDTGTCSTNCLINCVGMHVHQLERGFHNYLLPLAWDCRLGVIDRESAIEELSETPSSESVQPILRILDYAPRMISRVREVAVVLREKTHTAFLEAYFCCDGDVDPDVLRQHTAQLLPKYMVPASFVRVDSLPKNESGKTDYALLTTGHYHAHPDAAVKGNRTEEKVRSVWKKVLEIDECGLDIEFTRLGGDSLSAVILRSLLETEFHLDLDSQDIFKAPTIREMARLLQNVASEENRNAKKKAVAIETLALSSQRNTPRIVLLPGVWDDTSVYSDFVAALGNSVSVDAIKVPGLYHNSCTTLADISKEIVKVIKPIDSEPCLLVGWSLGGLVAHALATELESSNQFPLGVLVLDASEPSAARYRAELSACEQFLGKLGIESTTCDDSDSLANQVQARWSALHGIPDFVSKAFPSHRVLRAPEVAQFFRYAFPAIRVLSESEFPMLCNVPLRVLAASNDAKDALSQWEKAAEHFAVVSGLDVEHHQVLAGDNGRRVASVVSELLSELIVKRQDLAQK